MKATFIKNSISAIAGLVVATGTAGAAQFGATANSKFVANPNAFRFVMSVGCVVAGTPLEFPDDIKLVNKGAATLPAGTKIKWTMTVPNYSGVFTLSAPLPPAQAAFVSHATGGVAAGHPCSATVI